MREEAAIRKALKRAKEDEEEAARVQQRRRLEQAALEAERLESGYTEPEVPEEPAVVEEPAVEEVVEEEETHIPEGAVYCKVHKACIDALILPPCV